MSFATAPTVVTGDVILAATWNTYARDNFNSGVWRPIAETVVSGSVAANIDFQPATISTFRHVKAVGYVRGDTAATTANVIMRINNDSSGNYDYQRHYSSAAALAASEAFATGSPVVAGMPANSAGANLFGAFEVVIPHHYNTANNKAWVAEDSFKIGTASGNLFRASSAGFWRNNGGVDRLTFVPSAGNFAIGSCITLYGCPS
jgi:hypothetical protein